MSKKVDVRLSIKDAFSSPLKEFAKQIGKSEKDVRKANKTIKDFGKSAMSGLKSAATAGALGISAVVAGASALAMKTSEAGDRVDKMSQKLGMSRSAFQEMDYVFSQAGINMDSFGTGMKTLSQAVYDSGKKNSETGKIFRSLGVSVKDTSGKFKNQEQVFKDTLIALQKMPAGINKAVYAQKLFGKQGQNLMPLLNDNNKNVQELIDKAHKLGMVMSDDAVNSSVKFNDTLDTLKRAGEAIGYTIGAELIPVIQKGADYLIDNMPTIKSIAVNAFTGVASAVKLLIDNMNWIIPVACGVLSAVLAFNTISTVIKTIETLKTVIAAVNTVQGIWNALMLANPIGMIALGIGALIGAIALLVVNWDKVKKGVGDAIVKMKEFLHLKPHKSNYKDNVPDVPENQNSNVYKPSSSHALGTPYFQGGLTRINEGGRSEVVNLPSGSQIIPHSTVEKSVNKEIKPVININVDGNLIGTRELFNQFADMLARDLTRKMAVV